MPIDIQALKEQEADLEMWDGQLKLRYRVHIRSTEDECALLEEQRNMTSSNVARSNVRDFCKNRLVKWDLTNGGDPVSTEPDEVLRVVPMDVMMEIVDAVNMDASPNQRAGRR